jgi:signal transduction histidine kinase
LDVGPDACLALLNEHAKPAYISHPGFKTDWKRPFVASEIGEALPYWEASLYLADPARMASAARQVTYLLFFLIALAIGAIAWGGYLIATETRRQLVLVEKKNDFVSNVSHELKTPLTSIRMFAELLEEGRIEDTAKRNRYLRIIRLESERLTRLINNVLDFAKLERNQKRYDKRQVDLQQVCERVWDAQQIGFQQNGFVSSWQAAPGPYPVLGDADALAQVIMNLLSNAEKYSNGNRKEIEMQTFVNGADIMVSVLDCGPGVPKGQEEKIFEQFYRAHDSLHSGIQGSGLGLTLARRIARDHGGDVTYTPRPSGGSNFTLRLPLSQQNTSNTT